MKPIEHSSKAPRSIGGFAALRASRHFQGTGASAIVVAIFRLKIFGKEYVDDRYIPRRYISLATLTVLALLACFTGSSLAETGHGYAGLSFGSKGTAAGQMEDPAGVAVNDKTGDVYVVDKGNNRIDEFEANGTFIRAWGWGVGTGLGGFETCTEVLGCKAGVAGTGAGQLDAPEAIAVDNDATSASKEDVYVTNTEDKVIDKFSATGKYEGQLTGICEKGGASPPSCTGFIAFQTLNGVAIDPAGNVWAYWTAGGNGEIAEFGDTGSFLKTFNTNRGPNLGLAVDSSDNVYLVPGSGGVSKFDSTTGTEIVEFSGGVSGLAVDPKENDVYVDERGLIAQYGPFGEPYGTVIQEFGSEQLTDGGGSGLAVDSSSGTVYIADSTSDVVEAFTEGEKPGAPLAEAAEKITGTTATLKGELKPPTTELKYYFEYNVGTSCTGGSKTSVEEGKGKVSQKVTGLEPLVQYTFCLVAENTFGRTVGSPETFNTPAAPPTIESESVSSINAGGAHLEGTLNPNNETTECKFQYGPEPLLEKETTTTLCEPGTFAASFGQQGFGLNVGLEENKTYYYRVLATNGAGTTTDPTIEHFTTDFHPETPEAKPPSPLTKTEATLQGVLNPLSDHSSESPAGGVEFRYRQSATECQGGEPGPGEEHTVGPKTAPVGHEAETVEAELTGLLPGAQYTYCLIATNNAGEASAPSAPVTFTTLPAAPKVEGESAAGVTGTEANLNAQIDPNGVTTTYHFEYGTTTSYGEPPTALTELKGSLIASDTATATVGGLQPNTTYHYRVVAENEVGGKTETEGGEDETFTTPVQNTGSSQTCPANEQRRAEQPYGLELPDCRAYEMVSPLETFGNDATEEPGGGLVQAGTVRASEDKEKEAKGVEEAPAVTYRARGSFAEPTGGGYEGQFLSRRNSAKDRWETRSITAPLDEAPAPVRDVYKGVYFTPELTEGLVSTSDVLTHEAIPGFMQLYRANFAEGSYQLVSNLEENAFDGEKYELAENETFPLGASTDLSHVVFQAGEEDQEASQLYGFVDGRVLEESVSNAGEPWSASVGYHSGNGELVAQNVWHAMSADGSRVVFTHGRGEGPLYVRQNGEQMQSPIKNANTPGEECEEPADACTIELAAGPARYWGANTEDTKIFYTEGGNLYEYTLPAGGVSGTATPLTHAGEVQGVVQISEDGSYVYFVANGVLGDAAAHGATLGNCEVNEQGNKATGTACNLYVSHEGGEPSFIATLSANDGSDWLPGPVKDSAVIAPGVLGGARLAFTSEESLTGYDNEPAEPKDCTEVSHGETVFIPCGEIYLYDAEVGTLACASCNPTGARPVGGASLSHGGPGHESGDYRPRALLADGRLFFDSRDALVPHASDGRQNVYEYEDGHVYAISNVAGGQESFFLDASPDGQDVFFGSSDKLLPEDTGNGVVVWDARAGGGFPVTVAPQACATAEACRAASPPTPGVYGPPPSATFSGPGNVSPPPPAVVKPKAKVVKCKKGEVKKKVKKKETCVKKPKEKSKAKKSAHTNRRAHS
jgi:NHL repeat